MKKGCILMSLFSLTAMLAGCLGESESKVEMPFSEDAEMRTILENMTGKEVPSKTPLVGKRERALVSIVSLTVQQSNTLLAAETEKALQEKALSQEEILEAVYQCAPYSGFSRAADAAKIVETVFRKNGIRVTPKRQVTDGTASDRFQKGVDAQIALFGKKFEEIKAKGMDDVPMSNYFLATNCFGDYYTRQGLDLPTRELITMAMLVNLGTEPQLKAHIGANLAGGRSKEYLEQIIYTVLPFCGYPRMLNALRCLEEAYAQSKEQPKAKGTESLANAEKIFPRGEKNPYGKYFKGQSYLKMLNLKDVPVGNVTFEPGCRNKWHIHRGGGQLLIATSGEGWLQIEGEQAKKLLPGDAVFIPKGVKHWHGATKDSWFSHLSVEVPDPTAKGSGTDWFEDVADADYDAL